ncbi:MAG TPA: hypothetical protein VIK39_07850, partial [Candidatus Angelobacter sp.]
MPEAVRGRSFDRGIAGDRVIGKTENLPLINTDDTDLKDCQDAAIAKKASFLVFYIAPLALRAGLRRKEGLSSRIFRHDYAGL